MPSRKDGSERQKSLGAQKRDRTERPSLPNRWRSQIVSGLPLPFSDLCQGNRQCGPAQSLHKCGVLGIEVANGLDHRRIRVLRVSGELLNSFSDFWACSGVNCVFPVPISPASPAPDRT